MKKTLFIVLLAFLLLFSSCNISEKDSCNHEWTITKVTGGKVSQSTGKVLSNCTVIETCSLCGLVQGYEKAPTVGLSYSVNETKTEATVSYDSCEEKGTVYIPAQVVSSPDSKVVDVVTVGSFAGAMIQQVFVPEGIKVIGDSAFTSCYVLERAHMTSIEEIGEQAFMDCYGLREVNLPEGLSIPEGAFLNCYNLRAVTPASCVTGNPNSFTECSIIEDKYGL